jgi:hypothetical protein
MVGVIGNRRHFSGEIDRGGHTADPVEALLDPGGAGGARHPLDDEVNRRHEGH